MSYGVGHLEFIGGHVMPKKNTVGTTTIAELLGVSRSVIIGMLERREIAGVRAGRNWRIPLSEKQRLERELRGAA